MVNIISYRAGGLEGLDSLGYHHVSISTPDLSFQFFVHEREYDFFRESLVKDGYEDLGPARIAYQGDDEITSRFSSLAPQVGSR